MTRAVIVVVTVLVLCLVAPASAVATTETAETITLTVSVVNQAGEPVKDAKLTAKWSNGSTTETTASNGKAFVDVPKGADVTISVSHPDYIRNHPYTVQNANEREVEIPVYRRGQLSVVVADDTGTVANAKVSIRKDGRIAATGTTGADGSYTTGDIEQGKYTVSVVKPGYFRNTTSVTVGASTETRVLIERGTVTLTVAVRDPHFSPPKPVSGATVKIESIGQFTTLPEGKTSVSVPVNTDLSITVTKEGYETVIHDVRIRESNHRENVSLSRTPSLTITPVNRRVVVGEKVVVKVTDEYDTPVSGATVLLDGQAVGTTDDSGQLAVPIEEAGNHTLVAKTQKLRSPPANVTAIATDTETPTATPTPTSTATPTATSTSTQVGFDGFTTGSALLALTIVALALLTLVRRR